MVMSMAVAIPISFLGQSAVTRYLEETEPHREVPSSLLRSSVNKVQRRQARGVCRRDFLWVNLLKPF